MGCSIQCGPWQVLVVLGLHSDCTMFLATKRFFDCLRLQEYSQKPRRILAHKSNKSKM